MSYRRFQNYNVPMKLLVPTTTKVKGVVEKSYPSHENGVLIYGSFRTFGGTETDSNGIHTLLDTGKIETWYRPDIQADCRLYIIESGKTYEIEGEPEDIEMRHQSILISVKRVGGKS